MIDILIGLVIVLGVAVGLLFIHIGYMKKELEEFKGEQRVQNEDIYNLMKSQLQHSDIISYLIEKDDLLGNKDIVPYSGIIGEA
jgi:hypothetical protein